MTMQDAATNDSIIELTTDEQVRACKPLSVLLKSETTSTHESLDQRIMRAQPFSDQDRYRGFLKMQYCFHWATEELYRNQGVNRWIPQLSSGCRLGQVTQDCLDLGITSDELAQLVSDLQKVKADDPTALGWLYTLEGSNLGAAFLFKLAKKLGFSEAHGALHLSGHPEGRGRYWKNFKQCLDAIELNELDVVRAITGARAAFVFVRKQVEIHLP
ncbi:biliverdin-producing heme oxygenase [Litoribacillus peritrichatus]|uniref:Biliverdin-producing heme oxygenase n=1 Tax=Litoribacillus peritrichatus TaxID=718191 RepID=A0ABP7NAZ4_9GAMM